MTTKVFTEEQIVPPSQAGSGRRRPNRAGWVVLVGTAALVVAALWWFARPGDWYAFYPGNANPTEDAIAVEGVELYPNDGELYFMTVSSRQISPIERVTLSFDNTVDIVDAEQVLGDGTAEDRRIRNLQLMDGSQRAATAAALDFLGVEIGVLPGALITTVQVGSAAFETLEPGDLVTEFGGNVVAGPSDLVDAVAANDPGDTATVTFVRNGEEQTSSVVLGEKDDGGAFLGVSVGVELDLPIDITIDAGSVGGPSAGLAWTLALVDLLTEGELTGGNRIAVTGTMNYDEALTVGPIGKVEQKAYAAREQGIDYFIVPEANAAAARTAAGGEIEIIGVGTLQDAVDALVELGGNGDELSADELLEVAAA